MNPRAKGILQGPHVECFFPGSQRKTDPVAAMDDLRSGVEALPETRALFTLPGVLDDHRADQIAPEMVVMVGAWEMPDAYGEERIGRTRYVNPGYKDRHLYADRYVRCACGALMVRFERTHGETPTGAEQDHTDGCKTTWRLRARADLYEERADLIERLLKVNIAPHSMAGRFGLAESRAGHHASRVSEALNLPTEEWKDHGREVRDNTEAALLAEGYTSAEVGRLWGVSKQGLCERVRRRTDYTVSQLRGLP